MQSHKCRSKQLAQDYVSWRLTKAGYTQWHLIYKCDLHENGKTRLCVAMRRMAYEFEKHYNLAHSTSMVGQFYLNANNCHDTFLCVVHNLFKGFKDAGSSSNSSSGALAAKWGRIIALFSFAGLLACRCYEENMPNLVYNIIDWLCDLLNEDSVVQVWIESSGGWASFSFFI
jgi:hypothetical protein